MDEAAKRLTKATEEAQKNALEQKLKLARERGQNERKKERLKSKNALKGELAQRNELKTRRSFERLKVKRLLKSLYDWPLHTLSYLFKGSLFLLLSILAAYVVFSSVALATTGQSPGPAELSRIALTGLEAKDFWLLVAFFTLSTITGAFAWAFRDALAQKEITIEVYGVLREVVSSVNSYENLLVRLAEAQITALGELELTAGQLAHVQRELGAIKELLKETNRTGKELKDALERLEELLSELNAQNKSAG